MSLQQAADISGPIAQRSTLVGGRAWHLHAAVLLVAAVVDCNMLVSWYGVNHGFYDSDWLMFYHAAERLRDGGQPYMVVGEFRNPPPFLLLARGALLLGYIPSRILWCLASAAMLLASGELTARATGRRPNERERLVGAAYILLYAPTILLIPTAGNSTAPVVLGYALAYLLFAREREGWGGAALCLTVLVKPQLAFLTLPLLLYKRRWAASAAYLGTAGAALALSLLVTGRHTFVNFYQMDRVTASMADSVPLWIRDIPGLHAAFLQAFPGSRAAGLIAYALSAALVAALAWYWRGPWRPRSARFAAGWAMLPMVDLLAAPYSHSDDLVLLIIPMVVLAAFRLRQSSGALQTQHTGPGLAGALARTWASAVPAIGPRPTVGGTEWVSGTDGANRTAPLATHPAGTQRCLQEAPAFKPGSGSRSRGAASGGLQAASVVPGGGLNPAASPGHDLLPALKDGVSDRSRREDEAPRPEGAAFQGRPVHLDGPQSLMPLGCAPAHEMRDISSQSSPVPASGAARPNETRRRSPFLGVVAASPRLRGERIPASSQPASSEPALAGLGARARAAGEAAWQRSLLPALLGLYMAPVLVVYLRQHAMVPAMLAALLVLWRAGAASDEPGTSAAA